MNPDTLGNIFDINRYAIHDGEGIRTTVFFKGCPILCRWCANPESQKNSQELTYLKKECILCGRCVEACPQKAIKLTDGIHTIDRRLCDLCGNCVETCPSGALELTGRTISARDLYAEVSTDRPFWDRSGGGVTISGGEPLAQPDFALAFLKICKDSYVHTTIETCLHIPEKTVQRIIPYVDTVICDLKIMDDQQHKEYTGASNSLILKNIANLLQMDQELLVRVPLIPGINDGRQNLEAVGQFLQSQRPGAHLELLPYHRLGEAKYERLGRKYMMKDTTSPTPEEMANALTILKNYKIHLINKEVH